MIGKDATSGLNLSKEDIDNIEEKILLYRTTSAQLEAPKANGCRKRRQQQVEEDNQSLASTTSQVNSDDDAASIVSRMNQIVVEQEEDLLGKGVPRRNSFIVDRRPSNDLCESSLSRVKSATNIFQFSYGNCVDLAELQVNSRWQDKSSRLLDRERVDVPEIKIEESGVRRGTDNQSLGDGYLTSSESDVDRINKASISQSQNGTESCQDSEQDEHVNSPRCSCFSSFLPERGSLRELDEARKEQQQQQQQQTTRLRSNTAGNIDRARLIGDLVDRHQLGQPMVNIRRSAWKLSEFDNTFNRPESVKQIAATEGAAGWPSMNVPTTGARVSEIIADCGQLGVALAGSQESASVPPAKRISQTELHNQSSLILRASKNAFESRLQSPVRQQFEDNLIKGTQQNGNLLDKPSGERRLSHAHSIVSLASSLGGCPSDSRRSGGWRARMGRRGGSKDKQMGDEGEGQSCFKSCLSLSAARKWLPIIDWLSNYNRQSLWGDLTAGLAVAVLNISTCLSAAVVAQTKLSVAFRASIINTFVYALLCSSRHTSFGSWSIMSQMLLVSVQRALGDELVLARLNKGPDTNWLPEEYERWHFNIIIMYTFLIGLFQLVCGFLKLGNLLASFIPEALCSSMIAATAFTMAIGQLANMCGTSNKILWQIERNTTELWADLRNPPLDITDLFEGLFRWIQQIALLAKYYDQINTICCLISLASVLLLILNQLVIQRQLELLFKRKIFVPFEMILLIIMIAVSQIFELEQNFQVTTCGPISIDFDIPSLPNFRLIRELWFQSLATALISYTMVYIMAKTYSNKLNYDIDCNQELIACGAGNLVGGLFDALPATASFSRTSTQVESGGQTQMASIINCIILVLLAQLLGQQAAALPVCVMAATLFYGFVRMMSRFSEVFVYWRVCKVDFAIWIVTFVSILTLDMVQGFIFGFIFSILTMLYRAQNRRCYMLGTIGTSDVYVPLVKYPLAQELNRIKIFQFCGPIHYVCADLFERLLRQKTRVDVKHIAQLIATNKQGFNLRELNLPTHIIIDFSMISYIDSAGLHVIKKIIEDYQQVNITIFLASLASHVAKVVKSEPSLWDIHKERFYVTLADAVHCAIRDQLKQFSIGTYGQGDL